jgi:hypothetical protein
MLISPTKKGLEQMITKVNSYMELWRIKINLDKAIFMLIGKSMIENLEICINGTNVKRVDEQKYLGVYLDNKLNLNQHLTEKSKSLMRATYSLFNIGLNSNYMEVDRKSYIYKTYCRPILTYGWEFVEITEKIIKKIRTDEGIILKRSLLLPVFKDDDDDKFDKSFKMKIEKDVKDYLDVKESDEMKQDNLINVKQLSKIIKSIKTK